MPLFRTNTARQNLNDWLQNQDPGRGTDNYSAAISAALGSAAGRQTPAQRYNTGADQNVQDYRTNYRLMAQRAADTAAAQTQALASGYDASYADSATAQGYQLAMENQHDFETQLRQLALEGYAAENTQSDALTAALLGAQQLETSANQMAQDRYQAQRDFLTGEVQQAQAEQDNFWGNVWNGLQWLAQTALQTYDNYKGYSQQQWENEFLLRQYEDELAQRALENERYNTEYADSRSDTAWEQAFAREQWDAELAQQEWERGITEQQLADDHALTQAQIANYGRRSSGGSGGGSGWSFDDLDAVVQRYANADLIDDEYQKSIYGSILAGMGYDPSSFGGTSTGAAPAASTGGNTTGVGQGISGLDYTSYARDMRAKGYTIPEIKEQFDAMRGNNTITSNVPTQADAAYVLAMANPNLTDDEIYRILNGG